MTKDEYKSILNEDLKRNGYNQNSSLSKLKYFLSPPPIYQFIKLYRQLEYLSCRKHQSFFLKAYLTILRQKYKHLCKSLGFEIPLFTLGKGVYLPHHHGIIINSQVKIGDFVSLRPFTVIGNKGTGKTGDAPIIGNNVDIGANVTIIGKIEIGDNVIIGAGSVVVKNIPSNTICVGNPAKVIRQI